MITNRDDSNVYNRKKYNAERYGLLVLNDLQRDMIGLFDDWLRQERQNEKNGIQNRKLSRRREFEVFGSLLYKTLFDQQIGAFFEQTLANVPKDRRLRVQLSFEGKMAELASIPWEYLYYPDKGYHKGFFLATDVRLVLSRYIPLDTARLTLAPAQGPLRILIVVSAPQDLGPVIPDAAIEAIEKLGESSPVTVSTLYEPTIDKFLDTIEETKPHVLHFIGHGQFNQAEGEGVIALLDIAGKNVRWVKDDEFAEYFVQMRAVPHLAFLHLCEGGATDFNANFAGLAPQLVRAGIQAVVAMQYAVSNAAASIFSRDFYKAVAKGEPVDSAVQNARWRITTSIQNAYDNRVFGTPVLYIRSRDGIIQPPAETMASYGTKPKEND
jgi:CHAT domain-containing protein